MKVIDLLNKIANDEETPKKIKYDGVIFENNGCNCYLNERDKSLSYCVEIPMFLNDEVEIIEEEKKIPEKLDNFDIQGLEVSGYSMTQTEYLLEDGVKENREMINWILDYLKSKGE